ncbi:MAG: hypothetical protein AB1410_06445 [Acidobacteriota bacterium]
MTDDNGERIILQEKAGLLTIPASHWKLGTLCLTNKRLTFFQPNGIIINIFLNDIKDIKIEKVPYAFTKRNALCILYQDEDKAGTSKAYLIITNVEVWRKKIYDISLLKINEDKVDKIVKELDLDSQALLIYIWNNRHAKIDELACLIKASTHMDVLLKIREIINPAAERIIGSPILVFENSKIDEITGERVCSSWWIAGQEKSYALKKEPFIDIFDENDHLAIIVELASSVQKEDIIIKIRNNTLYITAYGLENKVNKDIALPFKVDSKRFFKRFNNGILQVRLKKA